MDIRDLVSKYEQKRAYIMRRLDDFTKVFKEPEERIFAELAFCLCTPQSKATHCWRAVESLSKNRLLYTGSEEKIKPFLNSVRFNETKAKRIVNARNLFSENKKIAIKKKLLSIGAPEKMRNWLIENVNGFGPKESSHFLRNIGFGKSLAILDIHILRNLKRYGVIEEIPKSMTLKKYFEIEGKMKEFAENAGIPFDQLDLLFWSEETGMVFK